MRSAVGTQELVCSWISITVSFLGTEGVESWKSSPFHLSSLPQCLPTALSRVHVDGGTVHLIAETCRGPGSNRKQSGGNVRTFPGPRFSPRVQVSTQHLPGVLSTAAPSSPFPPIPQAPDPCEPTICVQEVSPYDHSQMFPNVASQIQKSMQNSHMKHFIQFILNTHGSRNSAPCRCCKD